MTTNLREVQQAVQLQPTRTVQQPVQGSFIGDLAQAAAGVGQKVAELQANKKRSSALNDTIESTTSIGLGTAEVVEDEEGNLILQDIASQIQATEGKLQAKARQSPRSAATIARQRALNIQRLIQKHPGFEQEILSLANQNQGRINASVQEEVSEETLAEQRQTAIANAFIEAAAGTDLADEAFEVAKQGNAAIIAWGRDNIASRQQEAITDQDRLKEIKAGDEISARKAAQKALRSNLPIVHDNISKILSEANTPEAKAQAVARLQAERTRTLQEFDLATQNNPGAVSDFRSLLTGPFDKAVEQLTSGDTLDIIKNSNALSKAMAERGLNSSVPGFSELEVFADSFGQIGNVALNREISNTVISVLKVWSDDRNGTSDGSSPLEVPSRGAPEEGLEVKSQLDTVAQFVRTVVEADEGSAARREFVDKFGPFLEKIASDPALRRNPSAWAKLGDVFADKRFADLVKAKGDLLSDPVKEVLASFEIGLADAMTQILGDVDFNLLDMNIDKESGNVEFVFDDGSSPASRVSTPGRGTDDRRSRGSVDRERIRRANNEFSKVVRQFAHLQGKTDYVEAAGTLLELVEARING